MSKMNHLRTMQVVCRIILGAVLTIHIAEHRTWGQEEEPDPTRLSGEMKKILKAVRADQGSLQLPTLNQTPLKLVGLVVGRNSMGGALGGAAIIRTEDTFVVVREGETFSHSNKEYVARFVSASRVVMEDKSSETDITLYSQPIQQENENQADLIIFEVEEVPLYAAARVLSDETGLKIAVSAQARNQPVSLYLTNVSKLEVLDALTLTHGLYMTKVAKTDIIRLHTGQEYARDASSFFDERTQIFTLKYPNARDVAFTIRDLFGDRVRLSEQLDTGEEPGEYLTEDLEQRLERFDVFNGRSQGFGSGDGGAGSIISTLGNRNNNNNNNNSGSLGNFRQRAIDNADLINRLELGEDLTLEEIAALEAADPEALAKIVQARADIHVSVIDRLNKVMVRTRDEKTMNEISVLVEDLDVPTPLVLLDVRVYAVNLERGLDTAFEWNYTETGLDTSVNFAPGGTVANPNLAFTALNDRFTAAMSFLQSKNRVTSLGQPSLLMVNNEVSRIFIGEEIPVLTEVTGSETIATDAAVIQQNETVEYERRPVGSTLLITPNINDDRTVTLRLLQEESSIRRNGATVLIPDGGTFVERTVDVVTEQSASGTFAAKHGQTVAIGGLIREEIQDERTQIPLLGDIPLLGLAFRSSAQTRQRQEIIIMMTPYVISTPGQGAAISRRFVENQAPLHPLLPEAKGTLELYDKKHVIQPSTDELDWDEYWVPRLKKLGGAESTSSQNAGNAVDVISPANEVRRAIPVDSP
ncbi:MAG: hypothetical protein AAF649_08915 [Verrucomicrobiota bacterium]